MFVCFCLFSELRNMFRQAMRSPVILFHVVPSTMRSQYEQISHNEHNPRANIDLSEHFSHDSLTNDPIDLDHAAHRLAQHRPHPQNNHWTPVPLSIILLGNQGNLHQDTPPLPKED